MQVETLHALFVEEMLVIRTVVSLFVWPLCGNPRFFCGSGSAWDQGAKWGLPVAKYDMTHNSYVLVVKLRATAE